MFLQPFLMKLFFNVKVFILIFSGEPRPPRFTSESVGLKPHTYNLTWVTDSFRPITEYRLLYRRSDVSIFNTNDILFIALLEKRSFHVGKEKLKSISEID